jgi:hypothetical protein
MTWAFVPLMPKAEVPARRGRSPRGQPFAAVSSSTDPDDQATRLVDVQGFGQHAVPRRHDHLDHAGDPGGGLGVAEVRLDRPQRQRPVAVLPVGGEQRLRFGGVTERGARVVCFHRVHIGHGPPGEAAGVR